MRGAILKLIFKDDKAFLTKEVALDFKQVELPPATITFKSSAFWTIRVINYIHEQKRLFVEVLDYQIGETEFTDEQLQLSDKLIEIEKVAFKSIDTTGWLKTKNGSQPAKYTPPKPEAVIRSEPSMKMSINPAVVTKTEPLARAPIKIIYDAPFSVPIKDVSFHSGKVSFEKKIQPLGKLVRFEILNENIIEQYDAIKNYFASILNTKKIQVLPVITTIDGEIESVIANSVEISKINKSLIEEVKMELLRVAAKKEAPGENQLFTMNEYLEHFITENIQQVFKDDIDFLETSLKRSGAKHHPHLRWLSSKHRHDLEKLRLVHKPFSFVFLLDNTDNFFIIWETLDTEEATFIWKFRKDAKTTNQVMAETNNAIKLILRDGRNEYRARMEDNFARVFHDYKDLHNGFGIWQAQMKIITSR